MNDCYYADCELFRNNEHCMDSITFCEKSLAEHDRQIRADAIDEVYRAWVDWNSGKYDEQYFDDVIDKLKERK